MRSIQYDEIVQLSEKLKKYAVEIPLTKHSTEKSPIPEGYVSVNRKRMLILLSLEEMDKDIYAWRLSMSYPDKTKIKNKLAHDIVSIFFGEDAVVTEQKPPYTTHARHFLSPHQSFIDAYNKEHPQDA